MVWMLPSILFSNSDDLLHVKKEKQNLVGHIVWSMRKNAFPVKFELSSNLFSTSDELEKQNLEGHIVWSMCGNAFPEI